MKDFIDRVLSDLKSNNELKNNSLIKLVVESANKSIESGDSYQSIYEKVKGGLIG